LGFFMNWVRRPPNSLSKIDEGGAGVTIQNGQKPFRD
jgi:hypothetical protein